MSYRYTVWKKDSVIGQGETSVKETYAPAISAIIELALDTRVDLLTKLSLPSLYLL